MSVYGEIITRASRLLIAASVACASAVVVALPAAPSMAADDAASRQKIIVKEKRLEDVQNRIREEQKSIEAMARTERSFLGDIEDASRRIVKSREDQKDIEGRLKRIRSDMSKASAKIDGLERERSVLSDRLTTRLAAMYRMRRGEAVKVIFSSITSASAARRHKYLTVIMDGDSRIIDEYEKNIGALEAERTRLASLRTRLEEERGAASEARRRAQAEKKRKKDLLSGIQRKKDQKAALVGELEEAAAELANILKDLRQSDDIITDGDKGFARMRGYLRMPVSGSIVSRYGKVTHPRFKTVTFNNGIVIDAPVGRPVKSVYDGRVVYAGWLKGYGQIMIVDNGGGYYTLFGYLSKILVERGEMVKGGAEIALVGDSGPQSAPGLYFEIRRRGVPNDPVPWFTAKR